MNKICLFLLASLALTTASAQHSHRRGDNSWRSEYHNMNSRKDVDMTLLDLHLRHPGELARMITPQDMASLSTLILDGVVNDADLRVIADLGHRKVMNQRGREVKAYLNVDLENVRYFDGEHMCDYLPDYVFQNCKSLRSIVLPFRLKEIGRSAFSGCSDLQVVAMPDDLELIGRNAFYDCTSLTSIYIPDYVTTIYEETFRGCTSLTKVSLPDGLTTIGSHAFRATGLTAIDLPASVRTIGECAFANTPMRTAYIPATVDHCAPSAFNTPKLQNYEVEPGNPEYSSHGGVLYSADTRRLVSYPAGRMGGFVVPSFVTEITPGVFRSLSNITSIEFECEITEVADEMFEDCLGLTRVVLPEGVTTIGREAFRGCKALTDVQLPSSLRRISAMAFRACKGMSHIDLPEGLEVIDEEVFDYCTHLSELVLPSTVRLIGNKAFYNCDRMMQLVVNAPKPPVATEKINDNLKKIILVVPAGSADAYRSSSSWGKFRNVQEN